LITRRIAKRIKEQDWFVVTVELLVVVAGILIALQLDAWAESSRNGQLERIYLQRLAEDLQIEQDQMFSAEQFANSRIEAARLLGSLAIEPKFGLQNPDRVPWAIETATWRSFPKINAFVYSELQSTGRLALISSQDLRRDLAEHYTALQHDARVGDDLTAQERFDAAVAGLLTIDELQAVENSAGDDNVQLSITPERGHELARSFSLRRSAIDELPGIVQHHTFNLRVIGQMRRRADSIIQEIESLLAGS
jgi:hypothetical protein